MKPALFLYPAKRVENNPQSIAPKLRQKFRSGSVCTQLRTKRNVGEVHRNFRIDSSEF